MARKFLYLVAILVVLVLAGTLALRLWPGNLSRLAFVPRAEFQAQAPLAANVYEDPAMWISRPGIGASDPALWNPQGLEEDGDALGAAVFFVHPTSYFGTGHWNAPLDDAEARGRAEIFVRGMASPFNKSVNVWAPRYRQAAFGAFLTNKPEASQALDAAYGDIAKAFDYFLASVRPETPLVLAGHSQGALLLMRLLHERVGAQGRDGPLARRIAAAYLIGWPISLAHDVPAIGLPPCARPDQAGCLVSWLSYAEPAETRDAEETYARSLGLDGQPRGDSQILCTNPLTGAIGGEAPATANLGTLVPDAQLKEGSLVPAMVPANCGARGYLSIGAPPELGPYVLPGNNYHVYDIPLFWANLRADVKRRVSAWRPAG
jgi:hypothetical protein